MLIDRLDLNNTEHIITIGRRHWFILFGEIFGIVLLWMAPALVYLGLLALMPTDAPVPAFLTEPRVIAFVSALWTLIFASVFYHRLTDHYLDVWVITDERIIMIDQRGIFRRSVASFRHELLQNLDIEINGFTATFMDIGTLRVETAGHNEKHDFIIRGVGKVHELKTIILDAAEARSALFTSNTSNNTVDRK